MRLVDETFEHFGIRGWRVLKAVGDALRMASVIANLEFDTAGPFRAAVAAEGGPVFGDVPNFGNGDPVVMIAGLVGAAG